MTNPTYGPALVGRSPVPHPHQPHRQSGPQQPYGPTPLTQQTSNWPYGQQPYPSRTPVAAKGVPAPARRTGVLSWVIGGLLVLLVVTGVGVVLLLQDETPGVVADPPSQGEPGNPGGVDTPEPDRREVPSPPSDCLVECNEPDSPGGPGSPDTGESNYTGSDDAAVDFVQDIANGDSLSAHSALCGVGKSRFPTPEELVADFYATLGFSTITGARLTDVYAADATVDAVVFELRTDTGDVLVEVYIVEEGSSLAVCGYDVS